MKPLRILLLCHPSLTPHSDPHHIVPSFAANATEQQVYNQLCQLGHKVKVLGLRSLDQLSQIYQSDHIDLCFNLMEEFDGNPLMDSHIVSYLEMLGLAYTGNGPKALMLSRDKSLAKQILSYHEIPTPQHFVVARGESLPQPLPLDFPLFVKSRTEEASLGISQASLVRRPESLAARVAFIHEKILSDAVIDEFIDGRELYVGVLGNTNPQALPIYEMDFGLLDRTHQKIATEKVKWDEDYRFRNRIDIVRAKLPKKLEHKIQNSCLQAFRALEMKAYVRFDLRLHSSGDFRLIEANPNPNLAADDEFALAAKAAGISYPELLERICRLALEDPVS